MGSRPLCVLLVLALTALLPGCGVPGSGPPRIDGTAPGLGARTDEGALATPQRPDKATEPRQLVELYLQAAAGGNDVNQDRPQARNESIGRVREFLTREAAATWKPLEKIIVVQVSVAVATAAQDGSAQQVEVSFQSVGELTDRGTIEPTSAAVPPKYTFKVVRVDDSLRIDNPPDGLFLSAEGLDSLYEARPIYFWDTLERTLVPDLRYLAKSVGIENRRPNEVMGWLLHGPSAWLRSAVTPLPETLAVRGRVEPGGQRADSPVKVNLAAEASSLDQDRLRRLLIQLQWSFGDRDRPVQLLIEGKPQAISVKSADLVEANRAMPLTDPPKTGRYCVVGGRVQPGGDVALPATLSPDVNSQVVAAAISASQAALVRQDPAGLRLWLGPAGRGEPDGLRATSVASGQMGRPVWLSAPSPRVLVPVGGSLWDVPVRGSARVLTTVAGVSAVAVAPDGRRLAMIAGGQVYLAPLLFLEGDTVQLGGVRPVASGLTESVGVAWSRENRLVVGGRFGAVAALSEVTVDGALLSRPNLGNLAGLKITQVVAYPAEPTKPDLRGDTMIEANGQAFRVFSDSVQPLTLCGATAPTTPSAAPSGLPSVAPQPPTAPFFIDGRP